jgi:hypothetical protein
MGASHGTYLWRVSSSRFTAGLKATSSGLIVDSAPILGQWRGHTIADLREFAASHDWSLEYADTRDHPITGSAADPRGGQAPAPPAPIRPDRSSTQVQPGAA